MMGQASWQIDLHNESGTLLRRLGGPSTQYAAIQSQIDALPGLVAPASASD